MNMVKECMNLVLLATEELGNNFKKEVNLIKPPF